MTNLKNWEETPFACSYECLHRIYHSSEGENKWSYQTLGCIPSKECLARLAGNGVKVKSEGLIAAHTADLIFPHLPVLSGAAATQLGGRRRVHGSVNDRLAAISANKCLRLGSHVNFPLEIGNNWWTVAIATIVSYPYACSNRKMRKCNRC